MLKGNVKVTLFDKDGNVIDSQEKSNLVTNASSTVLNMCAGANSQSNVNLLYTHMPVAETTLGGLLLFEDSFDNPTDDMVLIPNNNYIVACADRNVDSESTRRGGLNNVESGRVAGGYKSVWDFSTAQAINTISAIALTSVECGANPFACYPIDPYLKRFSSFTNSTGSVTYNLQNAIPLKYDLTTQEYYFAYLTNSSSPYQYKICKVRIPFYTFNVEDYVYEAGYVTELPETFSTDGGAVQEYYSAIDTLGGYAYLGYQVITEYNIPKLKYVKLNLSSFTYEDKKRSVRRSSSQCITVSNGLWYELNNRIIYAEQEDGTLVYTYDTTNDSVPITDFSVQLIPRSNDTVEVMPTSNQGVGGFVLYPYTSLTHPLGHYDKIKNGNYVQDIGFFTETDLLVFCKTGYSTHTFYIKNDYLGTIFNLDTPVIKTNATTMKVEYTLTNVTS